MAWPIFPLACAVSVVRIFYSEAVGKHGDFFETHFPIPHSTIAPIIYPLRPPPIPIPYSYFPTISNSRSTFSLILPHQTYLYIFLFPIPYPNTLPLSHFPTNILTLTLARCPCFPLPYLSLCPPHLYSRTNTTTPILTPSLFPFHTYPNIHSHPFHPTKICIPISPTHIPLCLSYTYSPTTPALTSTPHPYSHQLTYPCINFYP